MATPKDIRNSLKRVAAGFQASAPALAQALDGCRAVRLTPVEVPIIRAVVESDPTIGSLFQGKRRGETYGMLMPASLPLMKALLDRMEAEATAGARQGVMGDLRRLQVARRLNHKLAEALQPDGAPMPILFKFDLKTGTVRPVECESTEWPGTDADGATIYENTHFKAEADAWAALEREAQAWVHSGARTLEDLRKREVEATRDLADSTLILVRIQAARSGATGGN